MIRKMQPNEIDSVKSLIDSNFPVHHIDRDVLVHTLTCNDCETYVLVIDGIIQATASLRENRLCWVTSRDKRQGYARRIVVNLLQCFPSLYLYVKKSNTPAIRLYESIGFEYVPSDREKSYKMKG